MNEADTEMHDCTVRRSSHVEYMIVAMCGCGAWLTMQIEPRTVVIRKHTFNRLCPAVDLAYKRMKVKAA